MRVKVVAPFPTPGLEGDEIELPERATVARLIQALRPPVYAHLLPVSVNGQQATRRTRLHPGDLVVFLMPYQGG